MRSYGRGRKALFFRSRISVARRPSYTGLPLGPDLVQFFGFHVRVFYYCAEVHWRIISQVQFKACLLGVVHHPLLLKAVQW